MINRTSVAAPDKTPRPPKLHLPYETKKTDAGERAYDHRVGLCITLIAYLVLAIAFMAGKIVVGAKPSVQGIIIDTKTLAELEAEKMRLEQEVRARQQAQEGGDWRDVRNPYCNATALDERAHDSFHVRHLTKSDFEDVRQRGVIGMIPGEIVSTDNGYADHVDLQKDILKIAVVERQ